MAVDDYMIQKQMLRLNLKGSTENDLLNQNNGLSKVSCNHD